MNARSLLIFGLMGLSTAWQETCWQFTRAGGKVRSMLSYNQASVGLTGR